MKVSLLACCILVLATRMVGQLGAVPEKEEPTRLFNSETLKVPKQIRLDEQYQAWVGTLPPRSKPGNEYCSRNWGVFTCLSTSARKSTVIPTPGTTWTTIQRFLVCC